MNQVKKFKFRIHRSFSESISSTFDFVRMNYKMIWSILVRIPGPILLVAILILMFSFYNTFGSIAESQQNPNQGFNSDLIGGFGYMALGIILYMIASLLFTTAINEYIVMYVQSENPDQITVKEVFQKAKKRFWMYFGGGLLIGIMVIVAFMFLIIPGIYMAVATMYLFIIISAEGKSIGQAISRSFNVVSGYWWSSFGYILVIGILVMAISYIIQLPILGINTYMLLSQSDTTLGALIYGISNGLGYLVYLAISSLSLIAVAVYYFSIVEVKEQVGLQRKIDEMDKVVEETVK